jgi:ribosomal protein L18E
MDVAAFKVSTGAREQIEEDGEFMFIRDLVEENPEGSEVRIVK